MTLAELVMASALTAVVALAGSALVFAAARSSELDAGRDERAQRLSGLRESLGSLVRRSRTAHVASLTKLQLWVADDYPTYANGAPAGDDAPQWSEVSIIRYDSPSARITRQWFDFSGVAALTLPLVNTNVTLSTLASGNLIIPVSLSAYARTDTLCDDLDLGKFTKIGGSKSMSFVCTVNIGLTDPLGYQFAMTLRAPAYYLLDANDMTNDSMSGARQRRQVIPSW